MQISFFLHESTIYLLTKTALIENKSMPILRFHSKLKVDLNRYILSNFIEI